MSGKFDLGNYVEVDERITRFYDRYPEGRIATIGLPQVIQIDGKSFIVAQAGVWRTADDPQPCVGTAAEPFPGQTTFTKNSEMMNAETSAWGRALVAAGILAKGEGIASKNEVRNRVAERPQTNGAGTLPPVTTSMANSQVASPAPSTGFQVPPEVTELLNRTVTTVSLKEAIAAAVAEDTATATLTPEELGDVAELYRLGETLPKTPMNQTAIQALVVERGFEGARKRLIYNHRLQCASRCDHFKAVARSD